MKITLNATKSDSEPYRITRLEKVVQILNLSTYFEDNGIVGLNDHKGLLTVTWSHDPTEYDKKMLGAIWGLMNEDSNNVDHEIEEN